MENDISFAPKTIESYATTLLESLDQHQIATDDDLKSAEAKRKEIAKQLKTLDEEREGMTKPLDETKKKIMEKYKPVREMLEKIQKKIVEKMKDYVDMRKEQERKEKERQEEERKKAEEEKRKKEEEARAKEEEAKRLIEEAQKKDYTAEAPNPDESAKLTQVMQEAAALRSEAGNITVPELPKKTTSSIPSFDRRSVKKVWKGYVVNAAEIPRTVTIEGVEHVLLVPDTSKINELAKSTKGKVQIPGVEFKEE